MRRVGRRPAPALRELLLAGGARPRPVHRALHGGQCESAWIREERPAGRGRRLSGRRPGRGSGRDDGGGRVRAILRARLLLQRRVRPVACAAHGRVDAVVAGGFPIAGDYAYLGPDIQRWTDEAKADPEAWAYLDAHFDSRVALTFYRAIRSCRRTSSSPISRARCSPSGVMTTRRSRPQAASTSSPLASTATSTSTPRSQDTTTKGC